MSIEIRRAIGEDASDLIELNREFDTEAEIREEPELVAALIDSSDTERVFIAKIDGTAVGFATLQIVRTFCYNRPSAELTGIFVRPSARRAGIGSELIRLAIAESEDENVLEIFLRVNQANPTAISLYERSGFKRADHYEYAIEYYDWD